MTTPTPRPSRKVFDTPELLSLICNYATPRAKYSLLFSNKLGFLTTVPFVWREVDGVINLLKLLPEIKIVHGKSDSVKQIIIPKASNFVRFDFYAPHIRFLEIFEKKAPFFQVCGWRTLSLKAEQGPLLSKLSGLTVRASARLPACYTQCLMWITALVAPSLRSVRLVGAGEEKYLTHSTLIGSAILEAITRVCPDLQSLSLFPFDTPNEIDAEHFLLSLTPRKTVLQYLSGLRNLCELETGMMMVRPNAFPILGELPRLKRLTLSFVSIEPVPDPITLPDDSFPVLEHLILKNLACGEVELILGQLPLVRNIESLDVLMSLGDDDEGWITEEFMPRLEEITRLTNLRVDFDETKDLNGEYEEIDAPAILGVLAKLPLRTLDLTGVVFGKYQDFSETFPTLTKLRMPNQYAAPKRLSTFATIPNLEHLVVDVYFDDEIVAFRDQTPICRTLHTLESTNIDGLECSPNYITCSAEFLLEIFPNIKKVVGPTKITPWGRVIEHYATEWVNSQIGMHRELNKIRGRISKKYGEEEANSLIPEEFPGNAYEE